VAQQVTQILSDALEAPKKRSIMELQGLGKEVWAGIDAAEHIRRERDEWD
jgi:hypothetical protein